MISLDLMKSSEVRIAGDRSNSTVAALAFRIFCQYYCIFQVTSRLYLKNSNHFLGIFVILVRSHAFIIPDDFIRSNEIIKTKGPIYEVIGRFVLMIY